MVQKIIIAGFGGQGIVLAGKLLAYSAMTEGHQVSHMLSYGAEMRGGTCNCSVVISDKTIASPIIRNPDIVLVLNQPSKDKFEPKCIKKGKILINSSLVDEKTKRDDLSPYYIDATNIADKLGSTRGTNMVMLGALIGATKVVKLETMINSLNEVISTRNKSLIEINTNALKEGYKLIN